MWESLNTTRQQLSSRARTRRPYHYFEWVREAVTASAVEERLARAAPLRDDRIDSDPLDRKLEALAPDWHEGFFVLPRLPALDADARDGEDDA